MTTPTIAAVVSELYSSGHISNMERRAERIIAAVFDNLDRTAMARAAWEAHSVASPGARHWPNWDELYEHGTKADRLAETDAAIAAGRQAALGASATPTEG